MDPGRARRPAAREVEQLGGNTGMVSVNTRFEAVGAIGRDEEFDFARRDSSATGPDEDWEALSRFALDPRHLARNRVISAGRTDPAHVAFNVLRTRILRALKARGWSRIGITSPSQGCGKTFVASNLALSLSRQASCRTVLVDMDLRIPALARVLGVPNPGRIQEFLTGETPFAAHFLRVTPNLAVGLNSEMVPDSAELMQEPATATALDAMRAAFRPDVVLYDLPPALVCDDVFAFLPQLDCVLVVAGGGTSKAEDVRKCERLFADQIPILGVILNRSEDPAIEPYGSYGV